MAIRIFRLMALGVAYISQTRAAQVDCGNGLPVFVDGGDFHHIVNRPIQALPSCNLISQIKLHLNTRANPDVTQILDPFDLASVTASHFSLSKDTKILVHGFTDNYAWPWWADTKTELLKELDVNVIRVDWSAGNSPPLIQAAASARLVASYVAKLLNALKTVFGYDPLKVHLIGHSLGAHLVGYIGAEVSQIGRITGLDPAGLYFSNMPVSVRLDPSDAKVVDTINTDVGTMVAFAFGTVQTMGHLNFYVNGGSKQPGCNQGLLGNLFGSSSSFNTSQYDALATVTQSGYQTVMCNHYRALALFQETISSSKCALKSYQCSNYEQFKNGDCFSCDEFKCSGLGLHMDASIAVPNVQKKLYTVTSERPPYCITTFRVAFTLKSNRDRQEKGNVFLTIHGSRGKSQRFQLNENEIDLTPGAQYGFLVSTSQDIGPVLSVTFEWDARFNILLPTEFLRRHYITLDAGQLHLWNGNGNKMLIQLPKDKLEEEKLYRANVA